MQQGMHSPCTGANPHLGGGGEGEGGGGLGLGGGGEGDAGGGLGGCLPGGLRRRTE